MSDELLLDFDDDDPTPSPSTPVTSVNGQMGTIFLNSNVKWTVMGDLAPGEGIVSAAGAGGGIPTHTYTLFTGTYGGGGGGFIPGDLYAAVADTASPKL